MSVELKKIYNHYGIPYECEIDGINLIITNDGYINDIDDDGLFFTKKEKEHFKFGTIWLEFLNIFKTPLFDNVFSPMLYKVLGKYEKICLDFIKELYSEMLSIGCSSLIAESLINDIVWYHKTDKPLSEFNMKDCYGYGMAVFFKPQYALKDERYAPKITYFQTTFAEVDGKPYFVHCSLDSDSLVCLDIINCRIHRVNIFQCKHCHKYFIQEHGNNLKYCYECKSLPDTERRNDEFEKLYRKIYGRLRGKSRSMIDDEKEKYINGIFYRWTVEVTKQKKIYRQNGDFDGFRVYIEDAEKNIKKYFGSQK